MTVIFLLETFMLYVTLLAAGFRIFCASMIVWGWEITDPITPHPEFAWLAKVGGVETWEMYRTFNMGCGMIIAVSHSHANEIYSWLTKKMDGVKIIGRVADNGGKVVHLPLDIEYSHY